MIRPGKDKRIPMRWICLRHLAKYIYYHTCATCLSAHREWNLVSVFHIISGSYNE